MLVDHFPMGWVRRHAPEAGAWGAELVEARKAHLARWKLRRFIMDDGVDLLAIPLPCRWMESDALRLVLTYRRGCRLLAREVLLAGREPVDYPALCRLMDLLETGATNLGGRPMRILSRTMSLDVLDRRAIAPLRDQTAALGEDYVRTVRGILPSAVADDHAWCVLDIVCRSFEARRVLAARRRLIEENLEPAIARFCRGKDFLCLDAYNHYSDPYHGRRRMAAAAAYPALARVMREDFRVRESVDAGDPASTALRAGGYDPEVLARLAGVSRQRLGSAMAADVLERPTWIAAIPAHAVPRRSEGWRAAHAVHALLGEDALVMFGAVEGFDRLTAAFGIVGRKVTERIETLRGRLAAAGSAG